MAIRLLINQKVLSDYKDTSMFESGSVLSKMKQHGNVLLQWQKLIEGKLESSDLSENLFDNVLKSWIITRGTQAVKLFSYHSRLSQSGSASRMGTPAFRKTLDKL